mmetsp:Transcript_51013/g.85334  ORF Transcript_51013/g.85334 Transcript_51013/m.85334 type:complete len:213 (+) Transcript_51013:905-1543(+)
MTRQHLQKLQHLQDQVWVTCGSLVVPVLLRLQHYCAHGLISAVVRKPLLESRSSSGAACFGRLIQRLASILLCIKTHVVAPQNNGQQTGQSQTLGLRVHARLQFENSTAQSDATRVLISHCAAAIGGFRPQETPFSFQLSAALPVAIRDGAGGTSSACVVQPCPDNTQKCVPGLCVLIDGVMVHGVLDDTNQHQEAIRQEGLCVNIETADRM